MPGSGKTTLGKILSEALRRPFIDLDERITWAASMTVDEIFKANGENYFRGLEAKAVLASIEKEFAVIATGGGVILRDDNVSALRENGLVIFIDRPAGHIAADIDIRRRPLLKDGIGLLYELARERRGRYLAAAHVVAANDGTIEEAFERLLAVTNKAPP